MLKDIFKAGMFKRATSFGMRHKALGIGGLLAFLGWRNRDRIKALAARNPRS